MQDKKASKQKEVEVKLGSLELHEELLVGVIQKDTCPSQRCFDR